MPSLGFPISYITYPDVIGTHWFLFGGHFIYKRSNGDLKTVAIVDRWLLFRGGHLLRFDYMYIFFVHSYFVE